MTNEMNQIETKNMNAKTMRADGVSVCESMDKDASYLRSIGIQTKREKPIDERLDDFRDEVRASVLRALDQVMESRRGSDEKGWKDADLPQLFKALDTHAKNLFDRERL